MSIFLDFLPLACIFMFLFVFKQSSLVTGVSAYLLTTLIVLTSSSLSTIEIVHSTIRGCLISFIVAYVVFFGILLFQMMERSGKIKEMTAILIQSSNDKSLLIIVLITGLSPLIESTSGFGTAFLVVAPILLSLGIRKEKAAVIGLVSLLAVPWGALATGTLIGAKLGNISLTELGTGSAWVSLPVIVYFVSIAVWIAGGTQALKQNLFKILIFSIGFGCSLVLFNRISVELAGALSALVTTAIGFCWIRPDRSLFKVMTPYVFLTASIICTRLIKPIEVFLNSHTVIDLPVFRYHFALLYSPGFWLFVTCILTCILFKVNGLIFLQSLKKAFHKWLPFTVSTIAFVSMAEVMASVGMTQAIAVLAANFFGASYLFFAPYVGGLGGYLTASNTGSNAIFMSFQMQTAHRVHIEPNLVAYVQNAGASHSTMSSPSRITLAESICGLGSKQSKLFVRMILTTLGALTLISITAILWVLIR